MKIKIATSQDLENFWGNLDWEIKPINSSPLKGVKFPPNFEFVTVSGCISRVINYSGQSIVVAGMDIFRRDLNDYPYLINADHYSIYSTGDKSLFEIIQSKPEYHWIKSITEIPNPILNVLPETTVEKIKDLLTSDFQDAIGLGTEKFNP